MLATLGIHLLLEFKPGRYEAAQMESRLVAGHVRVAYSVLQHREYMRAGAPSEPILAEAAAQVMSERNPLRYLSGFLDKGLVNKGERGELVARLLLILAHDRAAVALRKSPVLVAKGQDSWPRQGPIQHTYSP